ncbi:MAG: aspartate/glutamate racemase family protein [Solobacterium sp.]|nr:aspartate/glutamate racemase family protein [Solobacterium sp.]
MKTIGLIGGMSWESTVPYYQIINETVREHLGGLHSAKIILYSVEFDEIEKYQSSNQWDKAAEVLGSAAHGLELAGADFILICTNTMHKIYSEIQAAVSVPVYHIAELTADELAAKGITKIGLLGTKYTMTEDFYKKVLIDRGIEVLIPEKDEDIRMINTVIFDELCQGIIREEAKQEYLRVIDELTARGAGGIILGCTEIGLLVQQKDTDAPLFDTTYIHAKAAAEKALSE